MGSDDLYLAICDYENLYQAYLAARKSKRYRRDVLAFSYKLEENLIQLQNELIWKSYELGPYRQFKVHEPKERLISALPFRDRVVQHAISRVIEPIFERSMCFDSYACRVGKGVAKAADRLSYFIGKPTNRHYLKCDVAKFFPSIQPSILLPILRKTIKDESVMVLLKKVLDSNPGSGLPIGNLLSQLFANVFLGELDFYLKTKRAVPYYLRYMDDFIILGDSKRDLWLLLEEITGFLWEKLGLKLNAKTRLGRVVDGIEFVGFKISPHNRLIKKDSMNRMRKRFRSWRIGKMKDAQFLASIGSWVGHAKGTASHEFVESILWQSLKVSMGKKHIGANGRSEDIKCVHH